MDQRNLFDKPDARYDLAVSARLRDHGILSAEQHAAPDFKAWAWVAVFRCALLHEFFTTDQVWAKIPAEVVTHENRAMGAVMRAAAKQRWITTTDRTRKTERIAAHRRPCMLWRSRLITERAA